MAADRLWGTAHRDRKAAAILRTLVDWRGPSVCEGRWLDAGCGSGGIAAALAPSVRSIVGADPQPWPGWTELAARHANLRFVPQSFDASEPPLPEASVDVAVCNQVYEHVQDPRRLLQNLARCLVPGGVCYFVGPNLLFPIEPHVFWPFVHWLPRRFAVRLMGALGARHPEYLDAFSAHYWQLRAWFREAGFEIANGLRQRAVAGLDLGGWPAAARLARATPGVVYDALAPLSPSFVFLLRKPA